jgi:hypothetical protein
MLILARFSSLICLSTLSYVAGEGEGVVDEGYGLRCSKVGVDYAGEKLAIHSVVNIAAKTFYFSM